MTTSHPLIDAVHAKEEQGPADQLAERIVQPGGEPDFGPETLSSRCLAQYAADTSRVDMIRKVLAAERLVIDSYRELIGYLGEQESTTARRLRKMLTVEERHADELLELLAGSGAAAVRPAGAAG